MFGVGAEDGGRCWVLSGVGRGGGKSRSTTDDEGDRRSGMTGERKASLGRRSGSNGKNSGIGPVADGADAVGDSCRVVGVSLDEINVDG